MRMLCCALALLAGCDGFARVGVIDEDPRAPRDDAATSDAGGVGGDGGPTRDVPGNPIAIDACRPDGASDLTAEQIARLRGGATPAPGQRYLYPYEGTVFPAAMGAPTLMWEGPDADAVLLELHGERFDYVGCVRPEARGRVTIPQAAWEQAGAASGGARDPLRVRLSTLGEGRVAGPIERQIVLAPDAAQPTLYYMSYGALGVPGVFRLRAGRRAEPLVTGSTCVGCHGVDADGKTMLVNATGTGTAYGLDPTRAAPTVLRTLLTGAEYAAVHPSGALYVATAHPAGNVGTRFLSVPALTAGLYDVATGQLVTGSNVPVGAMLPAFSPSGAALAFNDFAIDGGRGLAIMDFDATASSASNYRELLRVADAYPSWPSFLPDEAAIVFAIGQTADFSSMGAGFAGSASMGSSSDLHLIALATGARTLLARAMGFARAGLSDAETYLPFGTTDLHRNYNPRTSPSASSAYAWVYFDSYRSYGNLGVKRQIWGAAIDLRTGSEDPSHPPFWVTGQDVAAVNLRAVAVRN